MAIPWLCLVILPVASQLVHQWTSQRGGKDYDKARALQVDVNGNAWVAGWTYSSLDGNANKGFWDIFLMKFDAHGVHLWTRQRGGELHDVAYALEVDSVGNALVAGSTLSSLDGNTKKGSDDIFLMKFDAHGVHLWTRQRGGEHSDYANALQVDMNGNALVAGSTLSSLDGNANKGSWDMFLMKFDAHGAHLWTRQRGGEGLDRAYALEVDAEGNAWVAGKTDSFHLDGQHRQRGTELDVFLMKFDSQGVHQWTRVRGGDGNDGATALQVDDEGNALVAGYTKSSRLDGHFTPREPWVIPSSVFLMKFNARGVHQWTRVHGGESSDSPAALQVDANGHAWMAGYTSGPLDGNTKAGRSDIFLMKFDAQGVHLWTRQRGGSGDDFAYALQVDPTGHDVWVAGSTDSSLNGNSNAGRRDIFLMRFQAECSQATCPAGYARSFSQKSGGNSMCCVLSSTSTSTWTSSTTASTSITTTVSSTTRSTSITRTISSTTASTRTTSRTVTSTRSTTKASATTTSRMVSTRTSTPSTTKTSTRTTSRTVSTRTSTPSTTKTSTRTTSRTVSTRSSTRSTTKASTRTTSRTVSTNTSTISAMKASATTTSSALPTSSISTTSSTTASISTTTRKRSASKASTTSSTSVEQTLAAFPLSQLGEQQLLTTTAAVELDILEKPWISNVQSIELFLNPTSAPSEEDPTGLPSGEDPAGLPGEDDSTGLLVAAVVLPVLTACLCATLGICCYRAKLRQLRGAEAEPPQVPNPLAILPPFARSVKPLIFAWESRMTAEWPRGKVQKLSVRETAFELRGREFQFQPGHLRHFAWEDGTVQTVQSIHKNVVWWRTRHPHPAWQRFRWICTPKCQVENHHDMELMASEGDGYRCTSCSRFRSAGKHWYCPQHQVHVCPACAELPPEMPTLGLAATYLVDVFPLLARRVTNAENPDFYDICPNLAHGPAGMGYNRTCPRDGRPHCSIVDALEDAYSGKVTHFVSWCWAYSLKNVVSAIERWLQKSNEDPQNVFLWMCFFCNNQYRIKEEATQTGSDELKEIFESHLVEAGRMLVLLDTIVQPTYVKRAWCIFESYVCIAQGIPMNIILPNTAETFFREAMRAGKIELLTGAVDDLNVRHARAGSEQDEDLIKKIILTTTGFDVVNRAVRARLIDELTVLFRELFTPQPS